MPNLLDNYYFDVEFVACTGIDQAARTLDAVVNLQVCETPLIAFSILYDMRKTFPLLPT
jgi:hypothetical protein